MSTFFVLVLGVLNVQVKRVELRKSCCDSSCVSCNSLKSQIFVGTHGIHVSYLVIVFPADCSKIGTSFM